MASDFFQWLADNACKADLALNRYDGARRVAQTALPMTGAEDEPREEEFDGAMWRCEVCVHPVPGRQTTADITARFSIVAGHARECSAGVRLAFDGWCADNYLLIPGAVYNGNRFESRAVPYPPRLDHPADIGPNTPIIVTDVPRLNRDGGPSRLQLLTGDGAAPAVGFHRPREKTGFWLLTTQGTEVGDSGFTFEESSDCGQAILSISAPGVREDTRYAMCTTRAPSEDRGANLAEGQAVTLRLRVCFFPCPDVQHLFDQFVVIRKDMTGPVTLSHELPFSEAWRLIEEKQNRDNWWDDPGFYAQENGRPRLFGIGWGGGGAVATLPMLMDGGETTRQRAMRTLDFFFTRCISSAGFFYDHHDGIEPLGEWRVGLAQDARHLVRRDCEALYALTKQFYLFKEQPSRSRPPEPWLEAARGCADALLRQWHEHGQLGQIVDLHTGEIVIGGGANGGLAPAALARASECLREERYLRGAEEIAQHFHERYVKAGLIHGGTRDALKSPDSESSFALLESFVTLYEVTGERHWAAKAEETAHQCASWCVSYDFAFPPESPFGRLGMHTAGTIYPNVQNKHAAPGICTLSGDSLLRLFRATENRFYLDLLQEIAHNLTQYLSRPDRPISLSFRDEGRTLPSGWMNERVNMSDWEGRENVGGVFYGSCWPEITTMLTCAEVPGLYVQPDTGLAYAFDHIDVEVGEHGRDTVCVKAVNPTKFPARVKVLCENSDETAVPLRPPALWNCPTIHVTPGGVTEFVLARSEDDGQWTLPPPSDRRGC